MKSYGKPKIEIIKNLDVIKQMLSNGTSRNAIYQTLKTEGKIKSSKASFFRVFKELIPKELYEIDLEKSLQASNPEETKSIFKKSPPISRNNQGNETSEIKKFHFDPKRKIPDEEL